MLTSALNIWVKRQVLDSNNWTNTAERLLRNDDVRGAVATFMVNELYNNVDVAGELKEQLPPQAQPYAETIAGVVQDFAPRAASALLERPAIVALWRNANQHAHQELIDFINGDTERLRATGGDVILDLHPIIQKLEEHGGLAANVAQRLPANAGRLVLVKAHHIDTVRKITHAIKFLSFFLSLLAIALFVTAIAIARGSRRTVLLGIGMSIFLVGFLILVIRRFGGQYLVDQLSTENSKDAVKATYTIGTDILRNVGINGVIYGLGIMFAAWIAGPYRAATWCRRQLAPTMRNHPVVIYLAVASILLIVLVTGPTDAQRIFPLLILFGFAFLGTEILRRDTMREFPP